MGRPARESTELHGDTRAKSSKCKSKNLRNSSNNRKKQSNVASIDGQPNNDNGDVAEKPKELESNTQARCWVFTKYDYDDDYEKRLKEYCEINDDVYIIYGYEICPTTKRAHLQGCLYVHKKMTFKTATNLLGCHIEMAYKTPLANKHYCMKSATKDPSKDTLYVEYNRSCRPMSQKEKGVVGGEAEIKRWTEIRELCKMYNFYTVMELHPDLCFKYKTAIKEVCEHYKNERIDKGAQLDFLEDEQHAWDRPFQLTVAKHIDDSLLKHIPRKIVWVYERDGGVGKSTFCQWLRIKYPDIVQVLAPANFRDLAHLLDNEKKIFVIDVQMDNMKEFPYAFCESLKTGYVVSTKYEGGFKTIRRPIVIVFANHSPEVGRMSEGRYIIVKADGTATHQVVEYIN